MPTVIFNSLAALSTAIVGAAGVAIASFSGAGEPAHGDSSIDRLTRAEIAQHAWMEFERADRNDDKSIDADEFAALSIVKAELAHLNGFILIEGRDGPRRLELPFEAPAALGDGEHTRIDAVARHTFYAFAGADGVMNADDYIGFNEAIFTSADRNKNQSLSNIELKYFAGQQAQLPTGV